MDIADNSDIKSELLGFTRSDYAITKVIYYVSGVEAGTSTVLPAGTGATNSTLSTELDRFKLTKKYEYATDIINLQDSYTDKLKPSLAIKNISGSINTYDVSEITEDAKQFISGNFANYILFAKDDVTIRRDVINRFLQLRDYVNSKSFTSNVAIGEYKFNDISLSTINIPVSAIQNFYDKLVGSDSALLSTTLEEMAKFDDETKEEQEDLYNDALKFARIFNSPVFYDTDTLYDEEGYHEATQALIDSKVITRSNLGYKNIIMLDSKEVTISNDQYDDLVTQSKFTDGDNITNPDCNNDINRRFRSDIRSANFMIVDKHKSIAFGEGANEGIFAVIIDPYDGMKAQRLLYHNYSEEDLSNTYDTKTIDYYLQQNDISWRQRVID
jgi:hypothetical protein